MGLSMTVAFQDGRRALFEETASHHASGEVEVVKGVDGSQRILVQVRK